MRSRTLYRIDYRLRAERRLGELLKDTVDHKGGDAATVLQLATALPEGISRTLNHITTRKIWKVSVHRYLSLIVLQGTWAMRKAH